MRRKSLLLMSLLLLLYIGPSLFTMSYVSVAIPTEQNMLKDFHLSDDPWLDGFNFRKTCAITAAAATITNYQIYLNVTYESDMQNDFDDLRFTDNDGTTPLDYWIEDYTVSTSALVWVEVKDNLWSPTSIYMYYGNATVSTTSNAEATFLFFDDFEDNNLDNWADTSNMEIATDRKRGSYSASWTSSASNAFLRDNTFSALSGIRISFWSNDENSLRGAFVYTYTESDYSEQTSTVRTTYETDTSPIYYRDTAVYGIWPGSSDDLNDDEWNRIELSIDFDADKMQTWQNDVANNVVNGVIEDDGTACETQEIDGFYIGMQSTQQCWFDDVIVRKWVDSNPVFDSWGEEEARYPPPPPAWHEVGDVEVVFIVAIDETGLNIFLIFAGLVMIPISILYLVKGGLKEMSTDKLFYGLIAFVFGWALFLGGIL